MADTAVSGVSAVSGLCRLDELVNRGAPDRPALSFRDETLTYAQLRALIADAVAGLSALGVRRGERVAVFAEKRVETVVALFAVSALGAVLVPVNPVLKAAQLEHVLADCAARVLITTAARHRAVRGVVAALPALEHVVEVDVCWPPRASIEATDALDMMDAVDTRDTLGVVDTDIVDTDIVDADIVDTDIAAIFYTSGSTGGPKGVAVSHRNLLVGAGSVAGYLGHSAADVVASVLPLSFDAGFSQLTTAFAAGAHVVLVNYLLPREVVRQCARHRVTALTGVPPLWMQLADVSWPRAAAEHLRYFANTGGQLPAATLARLRQIFPQAAPFLMYGLTEAFRSTYLPPAEIDRRPGSIGRAIPNAEVLVVRADGSPCRPGEHGELVHRGPLVARGYWNDPVRTAARFRPYPPGPSPLPEPPAVWSGDIVYRDADGFLYFVGRNDEMIKTSGYRVSPAEIEQVAYGTGLVGAAVAFGTPDARLGHRIVLVVTPPSGGTGCDVGVLRKALADQLPGYLVPAQILVRPDLPRSANGKFDRARLRQEYTTTPEQGSPPEQATTPEQTATREQTT